MTLIQRLAGARAEPGPMLVTETHTVTNQALLDRAAMLRSRLAGKRLGRVLLCTTQLEHAVVVMAALDGLAEAIGFASYELSAEALSGIAQAGHFDLVLVDQATVMSVVPGGSRVLAISEFASGDAPLHLGERAPRDTAWLMTTSGTTGSPRIIEHDLRSITRTTRCEPRPRPVRWAMLYDFSRFAGMQVLLQSLLSGATLIAPALDTPLDRRLHFYADQGVTHLSATPTLWRQILMSPVAQRLAPEGITLGGEIAHQATLDRLAHAYPSARIVHIFASTEAGVGFSVSDGREGFPASYLLAPVRGVALKVVDGILHVKNAVVSERNPGLADQPLLSEGWVSTGDLVEIAGDRVLFRGRVSGVINVGGNKVLPEHVEAVLNGLEQVSAARVYGKKNPITGALVAADVVLTIACADPISKVRELQRELSAKLQRHEIPAFIRLVDAIEINVAGKIKRT